MKSVKNFDDKDSFVSPHCVIPMKLLSGPHNPLSRFLIIIFLWSIFLSFIFCLRPVFRTIVYFIVVLQTKHLIRSVVLNVSKKPKRPVFRFSLYPSWKGKQLIFPCSLLHSPQRQVQVKRTHCMDVVKDADLSTNASRSLKSANSYGNSCNIKEQKIITNLDTPSSYFPSTNPSHWVSLVSFSQFTISFPQDLFHSVNGIFFLKSGDNIT